MTIAILIWVAVVIIWCWRIERKKQCPKCGGKMDRAGNEYLCRECNAFWHMDIFGRLKDYWEDNEEK